MARNSSGAREDDEKRLNDEAVARRDRSSFVPFVLQALLAGSFISFVSSISYSFTMARLPENTPPVRIIVPGFGEADPLGIATFFSGVMLAVLVPITVGTVLVRTSEKSPYVAGRNDMRAPIDDEIERLSKKLDSISVAIGATGANLTSEERDEIIAGITERAAQAFSLASLQTLRDEQKERVISEIQGNSLRRLQGQAVSLGARANQNLLIGIASALCGIILIYLTFFQFAPKIQIDEEFWKSVALVFAPRFSLVIVIELVAFYFLRLYSRTLTELRFVQNETTNIELKLISLYGARLYADQVSVALSLSELAKTERNFILEKGQTTTEIERDRLDSEMLAAAMKAAAEVIHGPPKPDATKA